MLTVPYETSLTMLRQYFRDEWEDSRKRVLANGRAGSTRRRIALQCCPIGALEESVLRLLSQNHDRPAAELAPQIQCMIADRDFAGDGGNETMDPHHDHLIKQYTIAITEALENVRLRAHGDGLWSSEPVTPLMCG